MQAVWMWTGRLSRGARETFSENGNKLLGFVTNGQFPDYLSDCWLLEHCVPPSYESVQ